MTNQADDPLDRLIDDAARRMTMGEPSARFEDVVRARLERGVSGVHFGGFGRGLQVAVTAMVVVAFLFLVWDAWRPAPPPRTAAGVPAAMPQDIVLNENSADVRTPAAQPRSLSAQQQRPTRTTRPLPALEPLALESLRLEPINDALRVDLATIEVMPLWLDPMGTATIQENQ